MGPSPQRYEPAPVAPDAQVVRYHSGELRLSAWINAALDAESLRPAVLYLHGEFAFRASHWEDARVLSVARVVMEALGTPVAPVAPERG